MDRISNLDCFSPVSHIHLKSVMSRPRTSIGAFVHGTLKRFFLSYEKQNGKMVLILKYKKNSCLKNEKLHVLIFATIILFLSNLGAIQ